MKKILVSIVLILFIIFISYYTIQKSNVSKSQNINTPNAKLVSEDKIGTTKEIKIGDMVLDVPKGINTVANSDSLLVEIPGVYKVKSEINNSNTKLPFYIVFNKNWNDKNLSTEEWFDLNGPQTVKTSTYGSEYDEYKKDKKVPYFESFYKAPTTMYDSTYYDLYLRYFKNKTDIYNIVSYANPKNIQKALTVEEKESIENYEKTVDEIIQSIRFVE